MPVIFVSGEHEKNLELEAGREAIELKLLGMEGGGGQVNKAVKLFTVQYIIYQLTKTIPNSSQCFE